MSRILAILMTDIQGFTERTARGSREELRLLLESHDALLRPVIAQLGGRIVKTIGDAFLIVYESPTNAVQSGMLMQDVLREFNADRDENEQIRIRVAVTSGEVEERDGDVFGEAVNMAARLEAVTEVGEVYFTESVYLAMNKSEVPSSEVGSFRLKGIPEEIKVYRVIQDPNSETFQQLLEQLRSGDRFADLDIPVTGAQPRPSSPVAGMLASLLLIIPLLLLAALCAWFLRPGPADLLRRVQQDQAEGKGEEAMALALQMENEMPALPETLTAIRTVITAETRRLATADRFGEARDYIHSQTATRPWLKTEALEKEIFLTMLDHELPRINYAGLRGMLAEFDDRYPTSIERDRLVVKHLAKRWPESPSLYAIHAATRLAEKMDTESVQYIGPLLLQGLKSNAASSESAARIRTLLCKGFPAQVEAIRDKLGDTDPDWRNNALRLLDEAGQMNDVMRMRVHVQNLKELTNSQYKDLEYSLSWLEKISIHPDFTAMKTSAEVQVFSDVAAMHEWSDSSARVSALLQEPFRDESLEFLQKSLTSEDDLRLRVNAYQCLKASGNLDEKQLDNYHAINLKQFDAAYIPDHVDEDLAWFVQQAGTKQAADARILLTETRDRVQKALDEYTQQSNKEFQKRAKINLDRVEKALKALQ